MEFDPTSRGGDAASGGAGGSNAGSQGGSDGGTDGGSDGSSGSGSSKSGSGRESAEASGASGGKPTNGSEGGRIPTLAAWLSGSGPCPDVVISSRARLARNLSGFPFVHRASREDRRQIVEACRHRVVAGEVFPRLAWLDLNESSDMDRTLLVERQLISKQLATGRLSGAERRGGPDEPRGVAIGLPDERSSVMVAEEDHLRLQVVMPGLALHEAYTRVDALDDTLEAGLDFAFDPRFGYLTACPTNVGTGLRLSVMLHLPGLKMTGELEQTKRSAEDMGLAVRGFFGEGSEAAGDFYQISNQVTLGKSEQALLAQLAEDIVPQVVEYERRARRILVTKRRRTTEDAVYRALGVLRHARLLNVGEAMEQLSLVRFGVAAGLIPSEGPGGISLEAVHKLILLSHKAHLQTAIGRGLDQQERRIERANLMRARLGGQ